MDLLFLGQIAGVFGELSSLSPVAGMTVVNVSLLVLHVVLIDSSVYQTLHCALTKHSPAVGHYHGTSPPGDRER